MSKWFDITTEPNKLRCVNTPEMDVHIVYRDKPNPDVPYLRLPAVPRTGDFILLEGGAKYKVIAVNFDDRHPTDRTKVFIEIQFESVEN